MRHALTMFMFLVALAMIVATILFPVITAASRISNAICR
jgi:hypothetical protein